MKKVSFSTSRMRNFQLPESDESIWAFLGRISGSRFGPKPPNSKCPEKVIQ